MFAHCGLIVLLSCTILVLISQSGSNFLEWDDRQKISRKIKKYCLDNNKKFRKYKILHTHKKNFSSKLTSENFIDISTVNINFQQLFFIAGSGSAF
jgi:hypothetical protein